jgi:hypothetical protein
MAGDWIPITTDLMKRSEVLVVSETTGMSRHEVVGWLVEFWGWAGAETADGVLRNISVATLVNTFGLQEQFFRCLCNINWLTETPEGIVIGNWDRWLSNSAKARLGNALRQKEYRRKHHKNVATNVATKALPQKRREEKRIVEPTPTHTLTSLREMPPPWNSEKCVCLFSRWFAYLRGKGKSIFDEELAAVSLVGFFSDVDDLEANMNHAIGQDWTTLKNYLGGKPTKETDSGLCDDDFNFTDEDLS